MDMCEYVFNPIMRNLQAMQRLISMMRDGQASDCNDVECFTSNNPNPLVNTFNNQNSSFFSSTWFFAIAWVIFALVLFLMRPSSMRKSNQMKKPHTKQSKSERSSNNKRSYYDYDDDDDNSTVS